MGFNPPHAQKALPEKKMIPDRLLAFYGRQTDAPPLAIGPA
jgi:hypothetical protein